MKLLPLFSSIFLFISLSLADSALFSQFVGSTAIPATFVGSLTASVSICTTFLHALPALSTLPASASSQIFQEDVDGVCKFCTSIAQTRIDSCCGQAGSSACFAGFGEDAVPATASASATYSGSAITSFPTSVSESAASATTGSDTGTTTATATAVATTSASNANGHAAVHLAQPIAVAMLGLLI